MTKTLPANPAQIEEWIKKSTISPRKRVDLCAVHWGKSMNPYGIIPAIMFVCFQPGSYVQPHQHGSGIEKIRLIHGKMYWINFKDKDDYEIICLKHGQEVSLSKGQIHTAIAWEENTVILEEYWPDNDKLPDYFEEYKQYVDWAPAEKTLLADEYRNLLIKKVEKEIGKKFPFWERIK